MNYKNNNYLKILKYIFYPEKIKFVGLLLAIFKSLIYYLICILKNQEFSEVMMLYSNGFKGDGQYYQFLPYVGNLQLSESQVFEFQGQGLIGFSLPSILLHSFLFARLGVFGYALADVIITYVFFCLFFFILKLIKTPHVISILLSILVISGSLLDRFFELVLFLDDFTIWGIRFPRPFVSEVFFLMAIAIIFCVFSNPKQLKNKYYWILLGLFVSLNLQVDPFVGFGLIIITIFSLLFAFWLFKSWQYFIRSALISITSLVIFTIPFLIQQLYISDEIKIRYGVFPLKGLYFLPLESYRFSDLETFIIKIIVILSIQLWIGIKAFKKYQNIDNTVRLGSNIVAIILIPSGYFAMTFFILITHQGIQLYHFYEVLKTFCSYATLFAFCFLCFDLSKVFSIKNNKFLTNTKYKLITYILILIISIISISYKAYSYSAITSHVRHNVYGAIPKQYYRTDFNELIGELKKSEYQNLKVMGTFDHQIQLYWEVFRKKYSYVPDIFISTVSDAEAEKRVINFAKIIGINEEQFINYIKGDGGITHHIVLFFGLAKYQVNPDYTLFDLTEYSNEDQEKIAKTPITETWNLIVPKTELERMKTKFINTKIESFDNPRLDVIVLTNDYFFNQFSPPSEYFDQVFENRTFRMWVRNNSNK